MTILETENLSFAYPEGRDVLSQVNISVKAGEWVAILGPNGCGKTTLFQHLNGLLKPRLGLVKLKGKNLKEWSQKDIFSSVGMVFQDPNDQLFGINVYEDVAYGPRNLKLPTVEVSRRVEESLSTMGIYEIRDKSINQLSFGQKKRVAIAGVLAMKPNLLILDEPTAGLDPRTSSALLQELKELQKLGISIIIATHDVDIVPVFCDKVFVMYEGKILIEGIPQDVFSQSSIIRKSYLRLPRIAHLWEILRAKDGYKTDKNALTIKEARSQLRDFRTN